MSVDKNRWKSSSHSKYNLGVHIIFCPKYRRKVLIEGVEDELKKICQDVAKDLKISIESIEVMPDHVHIFLKHPPTLPIHYIVQQIKGKSSRLLRLKFEWLKKRRTTLWTRSYFAESVGIINEDTIKKYIENQKNV